ncbi:hypothetical protein Q3G72_024056 [Acer saccharum]|nr:hypothetical protein Q3G72_024056 [Acer saccharum]
MNVDEIARLCGSMSFTEQEGLVRTLKTYVKDAGLKRMSSSLVGKVLSKKLVNREVFRLVMRKIWITKDNVEIEPVTENIFTFHFQNAEDKQKIIARGPWSFDDALIAMEEPEGKGDIQRMKFNKAEFWIQIHNTPLMCMSADIGRFLGSIVRDVDIDNRDLGSQVAGFLRVRVAIEIDKPLRRFLRINVLGDGVETGMLMKYERLLDFCFKCGLLGHGVRDCPDKPREATVLKGEELLFGFWLRASTPVKKTGNWGQKWGMREGGD